MIINVGSTNPSKINAVKKVIVDYDFIANAKVVPIKVRSEVREQPMSLEEISRGARNRAKNSFYRCDLSIGIESGLIKLPKEDTYLDVCVCAIYNRKKFSYGVSQGFEIPPKVRDKVLQGKNLTDASFIEKITNNPKVGEAEGLIGVLTKGRVTRTDYTANAIQMALITLENSKIYR